MSDPPEAGLFEDQIWVLFMIVFGCGVIFITIGLIIITIIKKRQNEDDHEHDFERYKNCKNFDIYFESKPLP